MLEKIKKVLFETYGSEEVKGLFLSWFDNDQTLLTSKGVLETDMPLHELLDVVYDEFGDRVSDTVYISVDIVSEIIQLKDAADILTKDPQEWWFALVTPDGNQSGVMLPAIEAVADAKQALYQIKKKYGIDGDVEVFVFRTERMVVAK